jgi:hypothetical protein
MLSTTDVPVVSVPAVLVHQITVCENSVRYEVKLTLKQRGITVRINSAVVQL